MSAPLDRLAAFLTAADLPCGDDVLARFEAYLALLDRARGAMNLVGKLSPLQLIDELVCDSLQVLVLRAPPQAPVVDVGSGAGFPGLPIKLVYPEVAVVLVEPRERRQVFLAHVVRTLGLEGVTLVRARVEEATLPAAGLACCKAFAPVPRWLELAGGLLAPGGEVAVLASRADWEQVAAQPEGPLSSWHLERRLDYAWEASSPRVAALLRRHTLRLLGH